MDDRGETAQTVGIRRPEGVDGLADVSTGSTGFLGICGRVMELFTLFSSDLA